MKLLFLNQLLPYPLDAGPKVRSYYSLRYLAQQAQVTLLAFVRASDTPQAGAHLRALGVELHQVAMRRSRLRDGLAFAGSLATGVPFLINRDRVGAMEQRIRHVMGQGRFDAVHADQLWMAPYALLARRVAEQHGYRPRLVLDQHNAVFQIPKRMAANAAGPVGLALKREADLMARYEVRTCMQFDRVVWVTREDQQALLEQAERLAGADACRQLQAKSSVIPICVDPGSLPEPLQASSQDILFVGGMHWPPNAEGMTWFAREVFPRVRAEVPSARLAAIGKSPPPALAGAGVVAPGYVEDVAPYWLSSRLFIVPLQSGGGMRIKILDAWAHGLPVVSTTIGAEGIEYQDGRDLVIADSPQDFASAVCRMLTDLPLARQTGSAGRDAVEARYDWRTVYQDWDEVYAA